MNNQQIILECFILDGEYVVLNNCYCYFPFYENELVQVKIDENYLIISKNRDYGYTGFCINYDFDTRHLIDFINDILPNLRKLSPDELMIKDIIT